MNDRSNWKCIPNEALVDSFPQLKCVSVSLSVWVNREIKQPRNRSECECALKGWRNGRRRKKRARKKKKQKDRSGGWRYRLSMRPPRSADVSALVLVHSLTTARQVGNQPHHHIFNKPHYSATFVFLSDVSKLVKNFVTNNIFN